MLNTIYVTLHYVLLVPMIFGVVVLVAGLANIIQRLCCGGDADEVHLNIHVRDE